MIDTPTPDTWDTVLPLIQLASVIILAIGAAAVTVGRQRPEEPGFAAIAVVTSLSSGSCLAMTNSVIIDTTHSGSVMVIGALAILAWLSVATLLAMWTMRPVKRA